MKRVHFTSQIEVFEVIKELVDDYYNDRIKKSRLEKEIKIIIDSNREIMFKDGELKSILVQRLGKRRLRVVMPMIKKIEVKFDEQF